MDARKDDSKSGLGETDHMDHNRSDKHVKRDGDTEGGAYFDSS